MMTARPAVLCVMFLMLVACGRCEIDEDGGNVNAFDFLQVDEGPAWAGRPFDLIYDGNWVAKKGTFAELNVEDELFVSSQGNYADTRVQGLWFTTGERWEQHASGQRIRVEIQAKSYGKANILYKVLYITNEVGSSGWREAVAKAEFSTFSFEYQVGSLKEGKNDFVMVFPDTASRDEGILIRKATLQVIQ